MKPLPTPAFPLRGEHLYSMRVTLQPPEVLGPLHGGIGINFHIANGEFTGPRLKGLVHASGGDWFTLRRDGIGELDVRLTLQTDDGALIDTRYRGLGEFGIDSYEGFLRGELPASAPLYTSPYMATAHPDYQWLHRRACVGIGAVDLQRNEVRYDIYALC
jgi:hypothetical protein